mgnify:CR=1 FL=1
MENKSWTVTYRNRDNGQRITCTVFAQDRQKAQERAGADEQIGGCEVWEVESVEPHEETLARILVSEFAEKQQGGHFACPRCGKMTMDAEIVTRNALSRRATVYICDSCGMAEAMEDNVILGGVTGTIWLGASVGILSIIGVVQIEGKNQIDMLWLWLISALLNTAMQEMLVRGYLYQMIKSNGNIAAAIIVSTGLFTFAHGGAFEAGILPVLNVITMSLFMTAVLEYTGSLIAPIVIHFLWNGVGAIILGGVSLAEDYPHLLDMTIHGNPILSGGSCKIEGSIIVLFMNLTFLIGFVAAKKRRERNT